MPGTDEFWFFVFFFKYPPRPGDVLDRGIFSHTRNLRFFDLSFPSTRNVRFFDSEFLFFHVPGTEGSFGVDCFKYPEPAGIKSTSIGGLGLYCNQLKKEKNKVFLSSKYEKKMISKNLFFFWVFLIYFLKEELIIFLKKILKFLSGCKK